MVINYFISNWIWNWSLVFSYEKVSCNLWCYSCVSTQPGCTLDEVNWLIHSAISCPRKDDKCVKIIDRKGCMPFPLQTFDNIINYLSVPFSWLNGDARLPLKCNTIPTGYTGRPFRGLSSGGRTAKACRICGEQCRWVRPQERPLFRNDLLFLWIWRMV